ncbi:MAG: esterase-like activity of phytase family protein [Microcoleaceae cyanobacterium]
MNLNRFLSPKPSLTRFGNFILKRLALAMLCLTVATACSIPQITAEDRMFLDLSLNFLGKESLPQAALVDSSASNLSNLTYEIPGYSRSTDPGSHFFGLPEHSVTEQPAQFYTLNIELDLVKPVEKFEVEAVKSLTGKSGNVIPTHSTVLENLVFSPRNSIFISTEEIEADYNIPFIGEFDLTTGQLRNSILIPSAFIPKIENQELTQGIQANSGFKSMTIAPDGFSPGGLDPFRLFISTEAPLVQDIDLNFSPRLRLLHYVIADQSSFLVSETLYPLESESQLVEMIALQESGHFLSLERSPTTAQLYQVFTGDATDISRVEHLRGNLQSIQPLRKQLLLDLDELGIPLPNLTGMTFGPRLSEGNQSLILIGHEAGKATELLVFGLT